MKGCSTCRTTKPLTSFGTKKGRPKSRCKSCEAVATARWRSENIERAREANRRSAKKRRADPRTRSAIITSQRESWKRCGADRQRAALRNLRETDFFAWKARKTQTWLTADDLRTLWGRQHGCCALSGVPLDETAHLDHKVPRARGGLDVFENAQWLSPVANQAKRDLLDEEFVAFCRLVVEHADRPQLMEAIRG